MTFINSFKNNKNHGRIVKENLFFHWLVLFTPPFCFQNSSKQSTYRGNLDLSTDTDRDVYYKSCIIHI